jgi:hypothetical protein
MLLFGSIQDCNFFKVPVSVINQWLTIKAKVIISRILKNRENGESSAHFN